MVARVLLLGGWCRLSVQQLDPIEEHMKASTTSQAISPLIARTSQDTVHWITCRALSRLRRGSDQHPSKVIQCSRSRPKSLAYSSVRIRCGLALLHVSILPSCFQSFQSSSICQRKRIRATTCRAESTLPSTLVSTSSHSTCRCLLTLTLWRFAGSLACLAARPSLGSSTTALDAKARGDAALPHAWLVSCVVARPLQANAGRSSAPAPAPACPLAPTPRPPARRRAGCATTPSGSTAVLADR